MNEEPQKITFLTKLRVELVDDEHFMLIEPLVVQIDDEKLVVPPGFVTDYDSVPKIPLAYLLLDGSGKLAAVMHDYLYSKDAPAEFKAMGRRWSDRAFWRAMIDTGVPQEVADPKYAGVRLGGGSHWEEA